MLRAFFGIPIDQQIIANIEQELRTLRDVSQDELRWIDHHYWHITLKFFSSVAPASIAEILKEADHIAKTMHPFELKVKKIAAFPTPRSKILAAHICPHRKLRAMHVTLDKAGEKIGIKRELRRYRPHITLAKFKSNEYHVQPMLSEDLMVPVTELVLFESKPTALGSDYIPLQRFKLSEI